MRVHLSLVFAAVMAAASAQAHGRRPAAPIVERGCAGALAPQSSARDMVRPSAEMGALPCPRYLSTSVVKRARTVQRT